MPYYTKEQWDKFNNASVVDFAIKHGFRVEKSSAHEYHVRGYGGLYIKDTGEFYCHNEQRGGGGIEQFAEQYCGMSKWDIMREYFGEGEHKIFAQSAPHNSKPQQEERKFAIPRKSSNQKNMYAYLINARKLSPDTIYAFTSQGLLYQGWVEFENKSGEKKQYENCIFLHKNESGIPCGADYKGFYTDSHFRGCLPHDDTDRGFIFHKGNPQKADTVYLFEAPIDLMSFVELHTEIENAVFVSMGGLKRSVADYYISSDKKIISCVDNDKSGEQFNSNMQCDNSNFVVNCECRDMGVKDFNELLQKLKEREPVQMPQTSERSEIGNYGK